MKNSYAAIIALTLSTLAAGYASAADAPKTRAQVHAELIEAQRTGDIVAHGNSGKKLNELYPSQYPVKAVVVGKTRAEVVAELAEAQRTGDVFAQGNSGKKLNELYPSRYPAQAVVQGNTRAEVLAELAQAKRSGEYDRIHSQHRN